MTPILPTPDHYLYNLLTMTSSEATRLWRKAVKELFDCTCVYCGKTYDLHELTLDHVKPRSLGGETITSNIVPACTCCNQKKGSDEWQGWMRTQFGINRLRETVILQHTNQCLTDEKETRYGVAQEYVDTMTYRKLP